MVYKHGTLENEIMNAVWTIETNSDSEKYISVNEVMNITNAGGNVRAYTTIKTVMDRLTEKNMLNREKFGKKFCYKSIKSREVMAKGAIEKLVRQYFNNDIRLLMKAIENQCLSASK